MDGRKSHRNRLRHYRAGDRRPLGAKSVQNRPDRARRIALSATKQSLKARIPAVAEPFSVRDFLASIPESGGALRLIAYCFEDEAAPRIGIAEALEAYGGSEVIVLIGPEGDFSPEEVRLAIDLGFIPVHLGFSRLRTETAAVVAATAVYLHFAQ